jgi:hypothetical protein
MQNESGASEPSERKKKLLVKEEVALRKQSQQDRDMPSGGTKKKTEPKPIKSRGVEAQTKPKKSREQTHKWPGPKEK